MADLDIHSRRLLRARSRFSSDSDFLLRHVTEDMMERLSAVQRQFDQSLAVAGRSDILAAQMIASEKIANVRRWEETVFWGDTSDFEANFDNMALPAEGFDFVAAPMTLHWARDLPGVLIQLQRSLKPDGLLLAALPGPDTLNELRSSLLQAESELTGGAALRTDQFTDIRDAGGLLQRTGFALPVVDQEAIVVRYGSVDRLISDLRNMGATFQGEMSDDRPCLTRSIFDRAAQIYGEKFSDPDGKLRATFQIVWMSGWKPHENQQKPLKPGSAKSRLADALNVKEQKL